MLILISVFENTSESQQSPKMIALLDLLEEFHRDGHRALIFSQYVSMSNIIAGELKERVSQDYFILQSRAIL